jgi:hypothetical protein
MICAVTVSIRATRVVGACVTVGLALTLAGCAGGAPVADAVTTCDTERSPYVHLAADGRSVVIDGTAKSGSTGAPMATVQCVLKILEVSDDVMSSIDATTTPDGEHSGTWDGLRATWSLSPLHGLHLTISQAP